jgi:release factor glutamine methyltransferase
VTVLEAIQKSTEFLAKRNIESPRLQCELLLAHVLKMPRLKLYLNFERTLTTAETDTLRELIKRRGQHEPLQHITGSASFCGHEIAVNRHVLVPRPETEMLAELGWQFLNQLSEGRVPRVPDSTAEIKIRCSPSSSLRVLDFCTGSGCIAIALAAKCPDATIVATDISADALALAKQNAVKNNVAGGIEFLQGDGFAALTSEGRVPRVPHSTLEIKIGDSQSSSLRKWEFDLILSNPPYIPSAEIEMLEPEVRDFDPRLALDGGADGLEFYRLIAFQAGAFLKPGGKVMVEFGDGHAEAIRKIFETEKWIVEAVKEDYSQRARILIAKSSSSSSSSSK